MLSCMAWPFPTSSSMISVRRLVISFLALSLTCLLLLNTASADIYGDAQALLAFKGNVTAGTLNLASWNVSAVAGICTSWKGVTCSDQSSMSTQRVIRLSLPGSSLYGSIPLQTLGKLDALQVLSLRKNKLSGSLPVDLANCAALRKLYLQENSFSDSLPFNFSVWPLLQKLDLSSNNFSGSIPPSLNNLIHLDSLFLQNNNFSGSIPSLGALPLRNFSVAANQLSGSIPSSLSNFPTESFAGNDLCGTPLLSCAPTQSPNALPPNGEAPKPPGAPESTNGSGNNKKLGTGTIVGIVLGVMTVSTVVLSACFLLFVRRNKKQGHAEDLYADGREEFTAKATGAAINRKASGKSGVNEGVVGNSHKLTFMGTAKRTFDLEDLLRASAEVLGKGSLGTSYKAVMGDGQLLCVKRFREVAMEREETRKHIEMLGALQHPNLAPLRAYLGLKEKLLVSDYMSKGSLSSLLHGRKGGMRDPLDWEMRLAIAAGVAKGVVFLHSRKVVHGNIKPSNVVFDSESQARLTDYSLVQLVPFPNEPSSGPKPTAYTPPEIRKDLRKITYKGDVYAFGVVLLELVTGKSPTNGAFAQGDSSIDGLVHWVEAHFPQDLESVLDPLLVSKSDDRVQDEMISLLHIALPCVSSYPEKRPHMVELVTSIESLRKHEDHLDSTDFYFTQAV